MMMVRAFVDAAGNASGTVRDFAASILAATDSAWSVVVTVGAVTGTMQTISVSMWVTQALHALMKPLCGILYPL